MNATISKIHALVSGFFSGNADKVALWFATSNPLLGGLSPDDMLALRRERKLLKFVQQAIEENELGERTP